MPVHYHLDDRHLVERGLTNYWGYNTLGFFAPHSAIRIDRPSDRIRSRNSNGWCYALHARWTGSDYGRGLQPYGRRESVGPDAFASAASTTLPITGWWMPIRVITWITPAAATR